MICFPPHEFFFNKSYKNYKLNQKNLFHFNHPILKAISNNNRENFRVFID